MIVAVVVGVGVVFVVVVVVVVAAQGGSFRTNRAEAHGQLVFSPVRLP